MKVIHQHIQSIPYNPGFPPPRTCWPDANQILLLQACLLEPERARSAWETWRARVDLQRLEHSSNRLMSLLYRNLERAGVTTPDTPLLKGNWRYHWSRNMRNIHELKSWLDTFAAAGIDAMVLKGIALLAGYYPDRGCRLMSDFDLLVRENDAPAAAKLLRSLGYAPKFADLEDNYESTHGLAFIKPGHADIDLHWHVLHQDLRPGTDTHFWEHAQVRSMENLTFRTLGPEDMLLHICEHGMRYAETPPMRWLVDAWMILHDSSSPLDLDYLARQAHFHRISVPLQKSLEFLRNRIGLAPDHPVLAVLPMLRPLLGEKIDYLFLVRPTTKVALLWQSLRLWRLETGRGNSNCGWDYFRYYANKHSLPSRRAVLRQIYQRLAHKT